MTPTPLPTPQCSSKESGSLSWVLQSSFTKRGCCHLRVTPHSQGVSTACCCCSLIHPGLGRHTRTLPLLSNYRRQHYPQDQTSIKFTTWVLKQKYKWDPHEGTSQLLPSSGFQGRGRCDSAPWTQSKETQFAFPKVAFSVATKGVFKGKKKSLKNLFPISLSFFKNSWILQHSMDYYSQTRTCSSSRTNQVISVSARAFGMQTKTFFIHQW